MDTAERQRAAAVADLAAVIERTSVDLSLAEEPSGFVLALEMGAPPPASR
jgi:hypothetical protein